MTRYLLDGEFPTCEKCIYRQLINSIFYCTRNAPTKRPKEPITLVNGVCFGDRFPSVSNTTVCGEGHWTKINEEANVIYQVNYLDAYTSYLYNKKITS